MPAGLRSVSAGTNAQIVGTEPDRHGRNFGSGWAGPREPPGSALHSRARAGSGTELRAGSAPISMETVWQAIRAEDAMCLGAGLSHISISEQSVHERSLSTGSGWENGFCAASSSSVGVKRKSCDLHGHRGCHAGEVTPDRARYGQPQPLSPDHRGFAAALSPDSRAVQQLDDAMQVPDQPWRARALRTALRFVRLCTLWRHCFSLHTLCMSNGSSRLHYRSLHK